MGDIYISSLAFLGYSIEEIITIVKDNNLSLEFSSGLPYKINMKNIYLDADIKKMPHNYFPAPEVPFVLNLASQNNIIRDESIAHCINGLNLAYQSNAPFFSAHAGFCIDPQPDQLGRKITYNPTFDKQKHKALFLDSIRVIVKEAERLKIKFLIENNVIAAFNLPKNNTIINPLLCCEGEDIKWVFEEINSDKFRLLLDTAHFKVSCQTFGLDLHSELSKIEKYIFALHHSDNDGTIDNNQPMNIDYWFLPYMKIYSNLVHVIEVKAIGLEVVKEQIKLLQNHGY